MEGKDNVIVSAFYILMNIQEGQEIGASPSQNTHISGKITH